MTLNAPVHKTECHYGYLATGEGATGKITEFHIYRRLENNSVKKTCYKLDMRLTSHYFVLKVKKKFRNFYQKVLKTS